MLGTPKSRAYGHLSASQSNSTRSLTRTVKFRVYSHDDYVAFTKELHHLEYIKKLKRQT